MVITYYKDFRYYFSDSKAASFDGAEEWPVELVRANGFDAGLTGISSPITAFPITVTCNGGADDGGAAFHWFLSQRTDTLADQYLLIAQSADLKSGSVTIFLSNVCVADLGLASSTASLNEDNLIDILTNCWLFVQRVSDGAIQMVDMLRETLK